MVTSAVNAAAWGVEILGVLVGMCSTAAGQLLSSAPHGLAPATLHPLLLTLAPGPCSGSCSCAQYIAEYGFAAHWKYKEKLSDEDEWLDKEVQYKKWLTNYKLGIRDMKVRPSGAPPQDCALKSLGMHLLDGSAGSLDDVDPFLRHDRFKLQVRLAAAGRVCLLLSGMGQ